MNDLDRHDRRRMRWILFFVFVSGFVFLLLLTGLAVFFDVGTLTGSQEDLLTKIFILEVGAAVVVLFYSMFGLKRTADGGATEVVPVEAVERSELGSGYAVKSVSQLEIRRIPRKPLAPRIRCSMSGLIRVEIDKRLLLVRSEAVRSKFQPIGGVYKRFRGSDEQLRSLGVEEDTKLPTAANRVNDLRVSLPYNNLDRFLDWYLSGINREVSPHREFFEEVFGAEALTTELAAGTCLEFLQRTTIGIDYNQALEMHELRVFDLYRLNPNEVLLAHLRRLSEHHGDQFGWFTADQIRSKGVVPGQQLEELVADHALLLVR